MASAIEEIQLHSKSLVAVILFIYHVIGIREQTILQMHFTFVLNLSIAFPSNFLFDLVMYLVFWTKFYNKVW